MVDGINTSTTTCKTRELKFRDSLAFGNSSRALIPPLLKKVVNFSKLKKKFSSNIDNKTPEIASFIHIIGRLQLDLDFSFSLEIVLEVTLYTSNNPFITVECILILGPITGASYPLYTL